MRLQEDGVDLQGRSLHPTPDVYKRNFLRFADCPVVVDVAVLRSVDAFWDLMRRDPVPRKLAANERMLKSPAAVHRLIVSYVAQNALPCFLLAQGLL